MAGRRSRVLTTTAPVRAEAMALWTPSEDSGSMNSPASPTSKKRASPNCVAVYKVASAAWGVVAIRAPSSRPDMWAALPNSAR